VIRHMLKSFPSSAWSAMGGSLIGKRAVGLRGLATKKKKKEMFYTEQPFDVPANFEIKGKRITTNVFVLDNIGSKFVMLNRPDALNALTLEMVRELQQVYESIEDAHMMGMVLLHGGGEKAFCAGGDVLSLYNPGQIPMDKEAPQMEFFREEYTLNHRIATTPKTTVSVLQGFTMGGGVGISAHGQCRVALPDTVWAMPETALGLFPDVGSSYFLPRSRYPGVGLYLGMTGRKLNATEAFVLGIATHHIEFGMQQWMFERLLSVNAGLDDPDFVSNLISASHRAPEAPDGISRHLDAIGHCFAQAESVESVVECVKEIQAKGGEDAAWAEETLGLLNRASPTSLAVVVEQMKRGAKLKTLRECLQMEFRMARRFIANPDFFEGVRAALVDKDRSPKWAPPPHPDQVAEYFEPLPAPNQELQLTYKPRGPLAEEDRGDAPRRLTEAERRRFGRD